MTPTPTPEVREPTIQMLNAAVDATGAGSGMSWSNMSPQSLFQTAYRAMIAASLQPVVAPSDLSGEDARRAMALSVNSGLLEALTTLLKHDEEDAGCVPTAAHLDAQEDARLAISQAQGASA